MNVIAKCVSHDSVGADDVRCVDDMPCAAERKVCGVMLLLPLLLEEVNIAIVGIFAAVLIIVDDDEDAVVCCGAVFRKPDSSSS